MAHIAKSRQVPENNIILYQDENGNTRVNVRFSHEDVWLNLPMVNYQKRQLTRNSCKFVRKAIAMLTAGLFGRTMMVRH